MDTYPNIVEIKQRINAEMALEDKKIQTHLIDALGKISIALRYPGISHREIDEAIQSLAKARGTSNQAA